jgi:hypothetical protein
MYNETRHLITARYYLLPRQNDLTMRIDRGRSMDFSSGGNLYSNNLKAQKSDLKAQKIHANNRY